MAKKILCAIDDSDHAKLAVVHAAELAARTGAPLTICTVNGLSSGLRGPPIYLYSDAELKSMLDGAAATARKHGAKTVTELEIKAREIATAVIQHAESEGYDHIVVGTGDKRGLARLVLGSVAGDIAGRAHCCVTLVR